MKKLLAGLFIIIFVFGFAACKEDGWRGMMNDFEDAIDECFLISENGGNVKESEAYIEVMTLGKALEEVSKTLTGDEKAEFEERRMELAMKFARIFANIYNYIEPKPLESDESVEEIYDIYNH